MKFLSFLLSVCIILTIFESSKSLYVEKEGSNNLQDMYKELEQQLDDIRKTISLNKKHEDVEKKMLPFPAIQEKSHKTDFALLGKSLDVIAKKKLQDEQRFYKQQQLKNAFNAVSKEKKMESYKRTMAKPKECPNKNDQQDVHDKVYSAPAPASLIQHSNEFSEKQRIEVVKGVHFFIGYAMGNSIVIEAPEGLIVVDTLEGLHTAREVVQDLRSAGVKAPFKALIYTHNHPDHLGGSEAFIEDNPPGTDVQVWSYHTLQDEFWGKFKYNRGLILRRSLRMFGVQLKRPALVNAGLGYELITDENAGLITVKPNRTLDGERIKVSIAGLKVELLHIPGETRDQMAVYIPSLKAMCSGDDVYKTFPNLYSIRGTPPRPVENWMQSIDKMLEYDVELLLPSHTMPVIGKARVTDVLTKYRDAIQYVFDQTIRLMNKGLHPDEVAQTITLPPSLRHEPHLLEHYGTVEWSSKTIFEGQLGWFSGYPEELYPLTPKNKAVKWVELVGADELLDATQRALHTYEKEDTKWALWLSTQVYYASKSSGSKVNSQQMEQARKLRSFAMIQLASFQTSPNGRNYLLTWALEENCVVNSDIVTFSERDSISTIPIEMVLRKLSSLLIPEKVIGRYERVKLEIRNKKQAYDLVLRNSILDVKTAATMNMNDVNCEEYDVCVSISINEEDLRRVINRDIEFVDTDAEVYPSSARADWFMTYFEDTNKRYY